jgi:anti-sigma factor RsiW
MSNLLHELENNEAILLMYLAGELPEEDRVEVEQMLANDPALRAELAELAALQAKLTGVMARVDGNADLSRREAVVRQVSRSLAAARLQPLRSDAAPAPAARFRLRIAWWAYPIAAAALLVIGIMLLSDNRPVNLPSPQPDHGAYIVDASEQQTTAQIFPAELEKELISLNSDGTDLFSPASPDLDR